MQTLVPENEAFMQDRLHEPVMLKEAIETLRLKDGMVVLDCTLGLGGHALEIIKKIAPKGKLFALDKDGESMSIAKEALKKYSSNCVFIHDDFRNLDTALAPFDDIGFDAVLFDLGVSSYQLENSSRGFSFQEEGPLDMRLDRKSFISAYDLLNNLTEEEIASIIYRFGQDRFSYRIARGIVKERQRVPISSTRQLAELIVKSLPHKFRFKRIHPATRTFQALRIAVNRELEALDVALKKAALYLNKGARISVISFHSLEDKIVKENFRALVKTGCFSLIVKKILRPKDEEIARNPRSRSAKMRVIERVK